MRITRLHHVQITIPEGEEARGRHFYCGLLQRFEIRDPFGNRIEFIQPV